MCENLHKVSEVTETVDPKEVNGLLKLGWILLSSECYKNQDYGASCLYSLGWILPGKPEYPPEEKLPTIEELYST